MNARILDLLKNPALLQKEDMKMLRDEISARPYQQSLRALHLYATHLFTPENYRSELSTTAAFTADKKILYQLINKKSVVENQPEVFAEPVLEQKPDSEDSVGDQRAAVFTEHYVPREESAAPVFVEGKRNRILFEGEEDFLERDTEKIDLEQTLESGTIVTGNIEKQIFADEIHEEKPVENSGQIETPSPEVIVETETTAENRKNSVPYHEGHSEEKSAGKNEEPAAEEEEGVRLPANNDFSEENTPHKNEDSSTLAYHGIEDFMPDVSMTKPEIKEIYTAPKPQLNRHEEEMKRLIEEVEAKIRKNRSEKKQAQPEEDVPTNNEVNFSENQPEEPVVEPDVEMKDNGTPAAAESTHDEQNTEQHSFHREGWKPLNLEIQRPVPILNEASESVSAQAGKSGIWEEEQSEETALSNSFSTPDALKTEEVGEPPRSGSEKSPEAEPQSNVPVFINTWQNWLKIDRTARVEPAAFPEKKVEEKAKVIDKFIEAEPKISKLKEESGFVVKEKTDDISHLMTETLAGIYAEQRLYAKAIKAYEILSGKHPEKAAGYAQRISEIKEMRQGKS